MPALNAKQKVFTLALFCSRASTDPHHISNTCCDRAAYGHRLSTNIDVCLDNIAKLLTGVVMHVNTDI